MGVCRCRSCCCCSRPPCSCGPCPPPGPPSPRPTCCERLRTSRSEPFTGYAETAGNVALPANDALSGLTKLLGDTNRVRVWWRDPDTWRTSTLRTTGETDLLHRGDRTLRWVYESKNVTVYPDVPVRLPTTVDLLPHELARRTLDGARPSELERLPARRVAGRDALGLRLTAGRRAGLDRPRRRVRRPGDRRAPERRAVRARRARPRPVVGVPRRDVRAAGPLGAVVRPARRREGPLRPGGRPGLGGRPVRLAGATAEARRPAGTHPAGRRDPRLRRRLRSRSHRAARDPAVEPLRRARPLRPRRAAGRAEHRPGRAARRQAAAAAARRRPSPTAPPGCWPAPSPSRRWWTRPTSSPRTDPGCGCRDPDPAADQEVRRGPGRRRHRPRRPRGRRLRLPRGQRLRQDHDRADAARAGARDQRARRAARAADAQGGALGAAPGRHAGGGPGVLPAPVGPGQPRCSSTPWAPAPGDGVARGGSTTCSSGSVSGSPATVG